MAMTDQELADAQAILAKGQDRVQIGDRVVSYDLEALRRSVNDELRRRRGGSQYRKVTFTDRDYG